MIKVINPIGHCFGVINAINQVKEIKDIYLDKNVYLFGLLVHNEQTVKELEDLGIKIMEPSVEELKKLNENDIVIFSAHGHIKEYEEVLKDNNVTFFDVTCPRVNAVFDKIKEAKEVIYIGKKDHPEVNAALSIHDNIHFYELNKPFDYSLVKLDSPLVVNQTSLSFYDLKVAHEDIKKHLPAAKIVDTTCDMVSLRQKAVLKIEEDIDTILIIGSKKSSNTMRLYETANKIHPNKKIYLVSSLKDYQNQNITFKNMAVMSGTSTSNKEINELLNYIS